jgi:hypothetical protein
VMHEIRRQRRRHLPNGDGLECAGIHHDFGRKLGPADWDRSG